MDTKIGGHLMDTCSPCNAPALPGLLACPSRYQTTGWEGAGGRLDHEGTEAGKEPLGLPRCTR